MKWFKNITTIEELRKQYRSLMKEHHPDMGGNTEDAKQINDEYDRLYALLSRQSHASASKGGEEYHRPDEESDALRAIIEAIAHIDATIEIIGSWVWVTKGSYPYKELLKSVGFHYASRKRAWYFHAEPYQCYHREEITLNQIRQKYGSQTVTRRGQKKALA